MTHASDFTFRELGRFPVFRAPRDVKTETIEEAGGGSGDGSRSAASSHAARPPRRRAPGHGAGPKVALRAAISPAPVAHPADSRGPAPHPNGCASSRVPLFSQPSAPDSVRSTALETDEKHRQCCDINCCDNLICSRHRSSVIFQY